MTAPAELLLGWLQRQLSAEPSAWFDQQIGHLSAGCSDRDFFLAVSYVPRKLGKADLSWPD